MADAATAPSEISLPDIAKFAWKARFYILVGLIGGLLLSYPVTRFLPDTINRTVTLTIYPTGTPTDVAADIQNQLAAVLEQEGFQVRSMPGGLVVAMPYRAADSANADGRFLLLAQAVADYRTRLLARVSSAYFDLEQRENAQARADMFVRFRSFQAGITDGSIEPVRITVAEKDTRHFRNMVVMMTMPGFGALLGVLVAIVVDVWRSRFAPTASGIGTERR